MKLGNTTTHLWTQGHLIKVLSGKWWDHLVLQSTSFREESTQPSTLTGIHVQNGAAIKLDHISLSKAQKKKQKGILICLSHRQVFLP